MLYAGKIVSELPTHVNIGKYILNLADTNIYVGTLATTSVLSWVQIITSTGDATKPVSNGEIDYFLDICKNNLLVFNSVTSLWETTNLSGQFDDCVNLYFILNGKMIKKQPLQIINIINSFPIYNDDVTNGYVTFPLQTAYSAIIVDKRSDLNNFGVYSHDSDNGTGQIIFKDIEGDAIPALTYFYYEAITKICVQLIFTYEHTNAPPTMASTTIDLSDIVRDNNGAISRATIQMQTGTGTGNEIVAPEIDMEGYCTGKFINNCSVPFNFNFSFAVPTTSKNGNPLPSSVCVIFSVDEEVDAGIVIATYGPSVNSTSGYAYNGSIKGIQLPLGAVIGFTGYASINTTMPKMNPNYIATQSQFITYPGTEIISSGKGCPP
jgi:hypothetical protein